MKPEDIWVHYHACAHVIEEWARDGELERIGSNGPSQGWYNYPNSYSGNIRRPRWLLGDLSPLARTAAKGARSIYATLNLQRRDDNKYFQEKQAEEKWRLKAGEEGALVKGNPLPEYHDIEAIDLFGDFDLEKTFKAKRGNPEVKAAVVRHIKYSVSKFRELAPRSTYVLDSGGGFYTFIHHAATRRLAEALDSADRGLLFRELTDRFNRFLLEAWEAYDDVEAKRFLKPDLLNNKNRLWKVPLSIHRDLNVVVHPINPDDPDFDAMALPAPKNGIDDALKWVQEATGDLDDVGSFVAGLWPEYAGAWDTRIMDWLRDKKQAIEEERRERERHVEAMEARMREFAEKGLSLADLETTDRIDDVFAAVEQIDVRDLVRTYVSEERGDGSVRFDPPWRVSDSKTSCFATRECYIDLAEGKKGGDAAKFVAREAGIISHSTKPLNGENWWRAVDLLRDQYGYKIPVYVRHEKKGGEHVPMPQPLEKYGFLIEEVDGTVFITKVTKDGKRKETKDVLVYQFTTIGEGTVARIQKKLPDVSESAIRELTRVVGRRRDEVKAKREEAGEDEDANTVRFTPCVKGNGFLAEQIWDGKTAPRYVVKHFDRDVLTYEKEISLGEVDDRGREIVYRPVYNDHLTKGMVTVPMKPVECTFKEVIDDIFQFVGNTDFFDPCGKETELKLNAMIAMGTWFLDRMIPNTSVPVAGVGRFAPILTIRGPSGSGKNRQANLLRFISYHPYFDLAKTKIPSLFRPLDLWGGTLIVDEGDFSNTGADAELIHFLNSRATGTPISRQNPDHPSESQAFMSFGITIITQRQHFDDNATEDRAIPFHSEKTALRIPTVELDDVIEEGLCLQNKLLFLRLKYWDKFKIDKRLWHKSLSDHRLNAALLPVMALATFDPAINEVIDKVVATIERTKKKVKAASDDGRLVNFLWEKLTSEEAGLYAIYNETDYYFLNSRVITSNENEAERIVEEALIATRVKEQTGLDHKNIRKILDSLNIAPEDAMSRIYVGKRRVRPIWFRPAQLEKQLREFVVDYELNNLFKIMGLQIPEEPPKEKKEENGTGGTDGTGTSHCVVAGEGISPEGDGDTEPPDIYNKKPYTVNSTCPTRPTCPIKHRRGSQEEETDDDSSDSPRFCGKCCSHRSLTCPHGALVAETALYADSCPKYEKLGATE